MLSTTRERHKGVKEFARYLSVGRWGVAPQSRETTTNALSDYVSLVEGAVGGQLFTAGIAALTDSEWFYFVSFLKALS